VDAAISADGVVLSQPLSYLFIRRGIPAHIRSDKGPEFIARALREWIAMATPP
jgi:hypothetical protein